MIRIGVLVDLAGSGQPTMEAAELAVGSVNAGGGIEVGGRRRPVELLVEDTGLAPDTAIAGARRLVQQKVVAIVGPNRSRDAIAAGGVAEKARIPMICPASTHPQTTAGRRYVFRVSFTDPLQGRVLGHFAREELGAETAAVLFDVASAYNRNLATEFRKTFEAAGGRLVGFESYTTGATDVRSQLERIREGRPQVLLLPNYFEELPNQTRQTRELGIDAVLLGGDSWNLLAEADLPPVEGSYFILPWHASEAATRHPAPRFLSEYRRTYGRDPIEPVPTTYDAFGLLFHAIATAGDDPDAIRDALAEVDGFPGVTGTITYREAGGDPAKRLIIGRVHEGGVAIFKVIEPQSTEPPA